MIKDFKTYIAEGRLGRNLRDSFTDNVRSDDRHHLLTLDNGKKIYITNEKTKEQLDYLLNGKDNEDISDMFIGDMELESGNDWAFMNYGTGLTTEINSLGVNSFISDGGRNLEDATPIFKEEGDNLDDIIPSFADIQELNDTCEINRGNDEMSAIITHKESGIEIELRCNMRGDFKYVLLDDSGKKVIVSLKIKPIRKNAKPGTQEFTQMIDQGEFYLDYSEYKPFTTNEPRIQFRPVVKGVWKK